MNKKEDKGISFKYDSHIELWQKNNEKQFFKERVRYALFCLVLLFCFIFISDYFQVKGQQNRILQVINASASFGGDYKFAKNLHFEVVITSQEYGTEIHKEPDRTKLIIFKYSVPRILQKDKTFKKAFNENLFQVKEQFNKMDLGSVNLDEVYRLQLEMDEIFKAALVGSEKETVSVTEKVRPNYEVLLK